MSSYVRNWFASKNHCYIGGGGCNIPLVPLPLCALREGRQERSGAGYWDSGDIAITPSDTYRKLENQGTRGICFCLLARARTRVLAFLLFSLFAFVGMKMKLYGYL